MTDLKYDKTNKKRKRLFDQYRDGLIDPPKNLNTVKPMTTGFFQWTCDSTTKEDVKYTITMQADIDNKLVFICNCQQHQTTQNCKHINTIILYVCLSQINNADNYVKNIAATKEITDELIGIFDKIKNISI